MSQLPTAAAETPERLLALHCSGSSGRQWGAWLPTLGERCGGVITPELMGYAGNEAWPAGRRVTLDDEAAALAPLLAEGPVHLLGHSYGAAVALQLALRCPSRVRSLTLYEPVRFGLLLQQQGQPRALGQSVVMVARRIGLDVMAGALDAAAERFVDYWSGIGSWQQMKPAAQQNLAHRMPKVHNEFLALFGTTCRPPTGAASRCRCGWPAAPVRRHRCARSSTGCSSCCRRPRANRSKAWATWARWLRRRA